MLTYAFQLKWMLAISILALCSAESIAADPPKTALLVAVGNYPAETGWQKISSINDVALIKKALEKQGFEDSEIFVVTDEMATKAGIVQAIRQYLVERAKPGGVAYFHFSGHGQQVADDNGDELDGYDEAIVPINSPIHFEEGVYEGENLLRDEELGELLDEVRLKLGPKGNLQVVLDACHSGTGTRGLGLARGTQTKMASSAYAAGNLTRGTDQSGMDGVGAKDESRMAPMVAFFGAAQHQLNFETKDEDDNGVGSLSYAFGKKLAAASPTTTYRGLFEQIKLEMSVIAPSQNPQVEGTLDQEIMCGRMLGAPSFYRVTQWNDPGSVSIEAGWLHGLQTGAVIGFFPPETRTIAGKTPLAKGTVTYSEPTSSTVTLDNDLDQEVAMNAWAFVLEQSFGDLKVSFKNSLPESHPVLPLLRSRLEKYPVIKEAESAELNLTYSDEASRGAAVQLLTSSGMVIQTFEENLRPEMLADRIVKQMVAYGQAQFLRNLELESYELPVSFEIIPILWDPKTKTSLGDLPLEDKKDRNGTVHLKEGDAFRIVVTNNGYKPAYFTLLDIQPDNIVNPLIPMPGTNETPTDFVVPAGGSFEVKRKFEIGPPAGTEVFKLIATDQPIDLRSVSQNRGQTKSPSSNKFERVFSDSFFTEDSMTRGGRSISVSATEVHVASMTFVIELK